MKPVNRCLISMVFAWCFAFAAFAQDSQLDRTPSKAEPTVPTNESTLTGKERTGRKWMDEQRIDNCNVPLDKRGRKPRPDCLQSPSG